MRIQCFTPFLAVLVMACSHPRAHDHHAQGHGMPHRFGDAAAWATRFDDPARDAWQRPDDVIRALAPRPDALIADVGAGTGYFAMRLSPAVAAGRVFAVDVEPSMVTYLGERARREGRTNVAAVQGAFDDPRLPEPVDLVLIVDTYHHIDARSAYLRRLADRLRPGARVAIVDFRPGQPMGPPEEHRVPVSRVKAEFAEAGFAVVAEHDFLPNQYFLVFGLK